MNKINREINQQSPTGHIQTSNMLMKIKLKLENSPKLHVQKIESTVKIVMIQYYLSNLLQYE